MTPEAYNAKLDELNRARTTKLEAVPHGLDREELIRQTDEIFREYHDGLFALLDERSNYAN